MNEIFQSAEPDRLALDYVDPRLDRRLQGRLAEVAAASQVRRITGTFVMFFVFILAISASEMTNHYPFSAAAAFSALILAATWWWARRCWDKRYRIAAHICIAVGITTYWSLFIIFYPGKPVTILFAGVIAAAACLLLGKRVAILWTLVAVTAYSLSIFPVVAAPTNSGPHQSSLAASALLIGFAVAVVWAIDRQHRAATEFAVVSDFERNAAVRLNAQSRLAETGRKTAAIGQVIRPMLEELTHTAEDACRFVRKLASRERADEQEKDFIDDLKISWESIHRNSVRASSVAQMMTRSDIDRPGPAADQLIDLGSLIQEQAKVLAAGLKVEGSAQVEICTEVDDLASTLIAGEYNALATMLQCLITNAVDSVQEKAATADAAFHGLVRISGRLVGNEAEIKVIDNGIGIDPSKGEAFFEPFYTTKPPTSGRAGLGLPTARATLVKLGGELALEPEPHHGGAVATAVLPAAVSASNSDHHTPAESPPTADIPPLEPPELADTDVAFERYRTDRYRVATVLTVALLVVTGCGYAIGGQPLWLVILAIQIVVSIASWAWFEGNPEARFNVAARLTTYFLAMGAIALAITQGAVSLPLKETLLSNFPPAMMFFIAVVVAYGLAGARLSIEVALLTIIVGFAGLTLVKPSAPEAAILDVALVASGATAEGPAIVAVMLIPNTFSLALQNARRSQALLEESRAARLQISKVETAAALGRVSSGVLHEVANPLNFIKNFAQVVIDSFGDYGVDPAAYRAEYDLYDAAMRTYQISITVNDRLDSLRLPVTNDVPPAVDQAMERDTERAML